MWFEAWGIRNSICFQGGFTGVAWVRGEDSYVRYRAVCTCAYRSWRIYSHTLNAPKTQKMFLLPIVLRTTVLVLGLWAPTPLGLEDAPFSAIFRHHSSRWTLFGFKRLRVKFSSFRFSSFLPNEVDSSYKSFFRWTDQLNPQIYACQCATTSMN